MNLAFSTNAYKKTSLEAAIDSIFSLGYTGVEIMADVPHAYPPDMTPERTAHIAHFIKHRCLTVSNINAFTLFALGDTYHPSWIEDDLRLVARRITHTQNVIRMSALLGAKTISLEPGGPVPAHLPRDQALRRFEAGLLECLPLAQQLGITLMVEPEPGLLIQHSHECIDFLQRINHPHLKMNCDLGHFFCVGEDPAKVLRDCAPWIAHIHLEDIQENRIHQHHIPGTGAMDWAAIFQAIRDIGYPERGGPDGQGGGGWITVELYPYETTPEEAARQALHFLRPYFS